MASTSRSHKGGLPVEAKAPVSVVIPCFRAAGTIERAVESAMHQSMQPAEVIVVDDFSEDNETSLALDRLLERASTGLRVVRLPRNSGPAFARNVGWEAATQRFVAFLDADDTWAPRKLELQLSHMQGDLSPIMSGHRMGVLPGRSSSKPCPAHVEFQRLSSTRLLFRNTLPTPSVILKRDIPYRFNPERRYGEDYELWLRVALEYGDFGFIDEPLAFSYKALYGAGGLSSEMAEMERGLTSVYIALFRERAFSWPTLVILLSWAKVRYVRRLVIVLFRKTAGR